MVTAVRAVTGDASLLCLQTHSQTAQEQIQPQTALWQTGQERRHCMSSMGFGESLQMGQHHAPKHLSYSCFQWLAVSQLSRGIRGTARPLSPLLYVLAAQPLASQLRHQAQQGVIRPFTMPDGQPDGQQLANSRRGIQLRWLGFTLHQAQLLRVWGLPCPLLPYLVLACLMLLLHWLAKEGALSVCQMLSPLRRQRHQLLIIWPWCLTPDDSHAHSLRRSSRKHKKPTPYYAASQAEPPDKPSTSKGLERGFLK